MNKKENVSSKAMILAAGMATRLKPITNTIPKALVKVEGHTLLEGAIQHLADHSVREIIINVHHFAGQITSYLDQNKNFGLNISISDESERLLDTGGGLIKASGFFRDGGPFFVRNVDIISDLNLNRLKEYHLQSQALATVAVRRRETSRYFLFDRDHRLCGWTNLKTGEKLMSSDPGEEPEMLGFSGIQIIDPKIFPLITEDEVFSLTSLYIRLAKNYLIKGYLDTESTWKDMGNSPAELIK